MGRLGGDGGGGCGRPGDGADDVEDGLVRRGGELVTDGTARLLDVLLTKPGQGKVHGGEVVSIEGSRERRMVRVRGRSDGDLHTAEVVSSTASSARYGSELLSEERGVERGVGSKGEAERVVQ